MTDNIPGPVGTPEGWLKLLYYKLFGYGGSIPQASIKADVTGPLDGAGNVRVNMVQATGAPTVTVRQETYTVVRCGEVSGSVTAKQLPQVACKLVKIVALNDNAGNVYIGGAGVTVANGTTDATTGLQLDGGQDSGWIPVADLNELFIISDNAGDDITYLALR